ncbi:DeoR/GlpR family DNA-binding transcription regulator [Enterococcus sp. LJL98]
MLTTERHQFILKFLEQNGTITIHEIAAALNTSDSTIRRDLQFLEDEGLLLRVHGGARKKTPLVYEATMSEKQALKQEEKQQIATFAADLIQAYDTIFLDAGSTTLTMIPFLPEKLSLKVVTNSVTHARQLLDRGFETIVLGGNIKPTTNAIWGAAAGQQLQQLYFDKAFLGMNGIDPFAGYTTPDPEEAFIKRTAALQSQMTYVLADQSKFGHRSFAKVMPLKQAKIITESCPQEVQKAIQEQTTILEVFK